MYRVGSTVKAITPMIGITIKVRWSRLSSSERSCSRLVATCWPSRTCTYSVRRDRRLAMYRPIMASTRMTANTPNSKITTELSGSLVRYTPCALSKTTRLVLLAPRLLSMPRAETPLKLSQQMKASSSPSSEMPCAHCRRFSWARPMKKNDSLKLRSPFCQTSLYVAAGGKLLFFLNITAPS